MAQNKVIRFGPTALTTAAVNYFNPGAVSGGVNDGSPNAYGIIKSIIFVNKTGGAATVSAYIGATAGSAAGTEYLVNATSIAANSSLVYYPNTPVEHADFLTALASANTTITIEGTVELGLR